jgi:uroporphyrinogen decarboxylase
MTRKEIVRRALQHKKPPAVPHYIGLTQAARRKLQAHYGDSFERRINNYLSIYYLDRPDRWEWVRPDVIRDLWGILWDRSVDKDIGVPKQNLFPEPDMRYWQPPRLDAALFSPLEGFCRENSETFAVVSLSYFTLYDRAWALRGIENLLADMVLHPRFVHELLDALTEWSLKATERILEVPGVDAVHFNDDWGQQRGLTMGQPYWRRFLQPRLKKLFRIVKDAGKILSIHSCGKVQELFPSLIELGLDLFNPFQPEVMEVGSIFNAYHEKLSFWGGLSVQRTLPRGEPSDVRREVVQLWNMGRNGSYILSPSHDVTPDVPIENLVALVETLAELDKKGGDTG